MVKEEESAKNSRPSISTLGRLGPLLLDGFGILLAYPRTTASHSAQVQNLFWCVHRTIDTSDNRKL